MNTYKAEWVVHVINWAKVHLDPRYANDYGIHSGLEIDFDTMFLGAQSSGSHVAVNYLALQQQQVSGDIITIIMIMNVIRNAATFTACSSCPLWTGQTLTASLTRPASTHRRS